MLVSAIVAVSENNVIGKEGHLPWHLSQDLKRFKAITSGHSVLLGRKNYEDIGRPLPNRTNYVLTRNENFEAPGCVVCTSLDAAVAAAKESGEEIDRAAMPLVAKLYLTRVHAQINGDVEMPPWGSGWKMLSEEFCEKGERDDFSCTFQVLVR